MGTMTRKDFEALASIISDAKDDLKAIGYTTRAPVYTPEEVIERLEADIVEFCASRNNAFDHQRFRDACNN